MFNHNKKNRTEKIIQFGEGGFLRGFVDWIVQETNEATDFDAGIVVVQPIEKGMCTKLEEQNCVYTHIMRGMKDGKAVTEKKVVDSITRTVEPYKNFEQYLKLAENKEFRFVVSNTTESGIAFEPKDIPENAPDVTFPAKVTLLMKKRFELGLPGFIVLPCELIEKNGETLKKYIIQYAKLWNYEEKFIDWIENNNIFCNTLVDRIVTGYPKNEKIELGYEDNMLNTSELFHLWVIQGPESIVDEFPFDKARLNIIVTDDLEKYRTRKVRILNGAHTSMIPYALLEGIETVGDCMKDANMRTFIEACVYDEIIPTLELPKEELLQYADNVFERFENPFICHLCESISLNSVSKFKVRVLPSILKYIEMKNEMPDKLLTSFAKLIKFYKEGKPNDSESIIKFMKEKSVSEILQNKEFWDCNLDFLTKEIEERL